MLKEQAKIFNKLSIALDSLILILSLVIAHALMRMPSQDFKVNAWILLVAIPVWHFFTRYQGFYASIRRSSFSDIFERLLTAQAGSGFVLAAFIFLLDKDRYSRGLFAAFILVSFCLLLAVKFATRAGLGYQRKLGYNYRNLVIVGTQMKAKRFHHLVDAHADWGLRILGYVQGSETEPLQEEVECHRVLGYASELVDICKRFPVDEVVFCLSKEQVEDAEKHLHDLEELGITVRMVLDFYELRNSKRELSLFHGELPILTFHTKSLDAQQLTLKRFLDINGALVGLGITALLFPMIALAIKLDAPGPLLFGQERVGESGRIFKCWKFRSMYLDAEERKKDLMAQNEMKGAIFKIKDDPRITKVGKFLRKTSLDELPQFFNVLKGEMSLVGTRPPTLGEVAEYENWHHRRISIKPGVTGMWQVSGRNKIDNFDEIVHLDLKYINDWSLWLDVKILLQTIKVVFAREGSC